MKYSKILILSLISVLMMSCENQTSDSSDKQKKETNNSEVIKAKNQAVEWSRNANVYEVNIRQYTQEGTFNAFAKELPRLKAMGVDILWFMPIHPIGQKNKKGSLGSYYSVRDYKAINPDYGTLEDFKRLVNQAHEMGMYVLIDWVANHTSWDNIWVESHPDFYERNADGSFVSPFDWTDVIALDYENKAMRKQMLDALQYWIKEADIDGYRCDVAGEVPTDFWNWIRPQLDQIKPIFMMAEAEKPELLEKAFDMDYGWELHHIFNAIAKGEKTPKDIWTYLEKERKEMPKGAYRLYFITNHDENSWNGTIKERLGEAADAMSLLTYTLSDMPLMYSGQESANEKRLEFFEKDVIDWKDYSKQELFTTFAAFKHENPALWNGEFGGEIYQLPTDMDDQVFAFKRIKGDSDMMVLINMSSESYTATFISDDLINYEPLFYHNFEPTMEPNSFTFKPWGYIVLRKRL